MESGNYRKRVGLFIIITVLFFFWGLANNMTSVLQEAFGRIMEIGQWQQVLIESAFYVAYFIFALPATYYIYRKSYKSAVLGGLLLYSLGAMLFFPASNVGNAYFYIFAIYVMAGGCSVLETVANPYIMSLAKTHRSSVRLLNLAQSFNPLGSLTGIMLGSALIANNLAGFGASDTNPEIMHEQLDSITMLYAVLGEVLMIFLVLLLFVSMPISSDLMPDVSRTWGSISQSLRRLYQQKRFVAGVLAQFLYVGAQTGVWGYVAKVASDACGMDSSDSRSVFVAAMVAFAVSRFVFTYLMGRIHHNKLMLVASVSAVLFCLLVVFGSGVVVWLSLILVSAMMSLMFPTIFGSSLQNVGRDLQVGSSLQIMAICGGAALVPLQNYVADNNGAQMSFIVPAMCFIGIAMYTGAMLWMDRTAIAEKGGISK